MPGVARLSRRNASCGICGRSGESPKKHRRRLRRLISRRAAGPASDPHVVGHVYGGGAIRHFLRLVLDAACSFRGASAVMGLLSDFGPQFVRRPAANTGQMWLLQVGLYELQRPKEAADDWVWILDHTVQLGTVKCLLIVGCRLSAWHAAGRPLEHGDLSVMALEPVEKSNGGRRRTAVGTPRLPQTGIVPRAILSDQGSDLKIGVFRLSPGASRDGRHARHCPSNRQPTQTRTQRRSSVDEVRHCRGASQATSDIDSRWPPLCRPRCAARRGI